MAGRAAGDDLQRIPGVGPSIARDLRGLGIRRVADLRGRDPERLYRRLNEQRGERQDPCVLYVFRCAVYFASTARPDPERLKWWWWKDRAGAGRPRGPAVRTGTRPAAA
ncbi:MAG TPA: helix-hairpin-helix domain-containing protein [Gemmatimonadales bacterium]|nr:helix-hairpin-helix domain-containing protein [Gemmatimonadales bacterium]